MLHDVVLLVLALTVIVVSCELFTNGIEWLGQRLGFSEGVVGSVLAAVGTALPETVIPFIAVFFFKERAGTEVGIGAIAGAPFMLSTLTLGLCGFSMWYFARKGRRPAEITLNSAVILRDLKFFVIAYTIAVLSTLLKDLSLAKSIIAVLLCAIYPVYLYQTFKHEGEVGGEPEQLHFDRLFRGGSKRLRLILPQIVLGLGGIIGGAGLFVDHVEDLARGMGTSPLILSLIVSPIATELPEKINSIIWSRSGKDTLAMGNVTGAMVFQSCIPVAFGVAFTKWDLSVSTILSAVVAILSAVSYLFILQRGKLTPPHLMRGAAVYAVAITAIIMLNS